MNRSESSQQQWPAQKRSEIRTCPECRCQFIMRPEDPQQQYHNENCPWICRFLCGECLRLEKFRPKLWEPSLSKVILTRQIKIENKEST